MSDTGERAACAHRRVSYRTEPCDAPNVRGEVVAGLGVWGWWECDSGCGTKFVPAAFLRAGPPSAPSEPTPWPEAVSDGLALPCADCGQVPRFDYRVSDDFWKRWVPGPERLGVICLPCLDRRCGGNGLADALDEVQWTGTGHTVVLRPNERYAYAVDAVGPRLPSEETMAAWLVQVYTAGHGSPRDAARALLARLRESA